MEQRPVSGFILCLLGGLFIETGTIVGSLTLPTYSYPSTSLPMYYSVFLAAAGASGILVILAGAMLYLRPQLHVTWGIMALVLSVSGSVGTIAGLFAVFGIVGVVFGVVGGALAIAWGTPGITGPAPAAAARICTGCGRYIPTMFPYCAYCGTAAPTFIRTETPVARHPPGT